MSHGNMESLMKAASSGLGVDAAIDRGLRFMLRLFIVVRGAARSRSGGAGCPGALAEEAERRREVQARSRGEMHLAAACTVIIRRLKPLG